MTPRNRAIPFLQNDNKVQILSLGDVLLGILFTLLVNIWWIILLLDGC